MKWAYHLNIKCRSLLEESLNLKTILTDNIKVVASCLTSPIFISA